MSKKTVYDYFEKDKNLKPIKTPPGEKILHSMDTEDNTKGKVWPIVHNDGLKHHVFDNQADYMDFVLKLSNKIGKKTLFVACTNVEYDMINAFRGFWDYLDFNYGGSLIYVQVKNTNIYYYDVLNHYKFGVAKQGEMIKLPKKEFPFDKWKKGNKKLLEYCKRDTDITLQFAEKYQKTINKIGADLKFTIASSAMNLFRRNYLKKYVPKINDDILEKIKLAYCGGRVEIFNMKAKSDNDNDIHYIDVNSLYPFVMQKYQFPDINTIHIGKPGIELDGVSHAEIEYIKDVNIPYFPVKYSGKLLFPLGKLDSWWTNFELRYGLEHKLIKIKKIHESINFKGTCNYFLPMINDLYSQRKNFIGKTDIDSEFMGLTLKLFMNSSYGKFGEHVSSQELIFQDGENIKEIVDKDEYYPVHTNYIWAVYVTAIARTVLYEGLQMVENRGYTPLYCDTDSIMFKGKLDGIKLTNELGDFKSEGIFKEGYFYQPKNYKLIYKEKQTDKKTGKIYEKKIACKGVNRSMADEFIETGKATFKRPIKLKESFHLTNKDIFANMWVYKTKELKSEYDKRIILKGGVETKPLVFPADLKRFEKEIKKPKIKSKKGI